MLIEEIFVEVPGYENYGVSNYGSVVNLKTDTEMKPRIAKGKMIVKLYSNGKPKYFFVHRLVAQAFFVDYDEDVDVYHISEDNTDNCIGNLHLQAPYKKRGR